MITALKTKLINKKFTKTEKIGLLLIILMTVFQGYFNYLYDPLVNEFEQKQAELATIQQEIVDLGGRVPSVVGMEKKMAEKQVELSALEKQLAEIMTVKKTGKEPTASQVLAQITGLALDHRLAIIAMTAVSPVEEAAVNMPGAELFTWWQCDLELRGSMPDLHNFVKSLVAMEKILLVTHIEWSLEEEQGDYKITIRILF